jgi:hypothetical protein
MPMMMNACQPALPLCSLCSILTYISLYIDYNELIMSYAIICRDGSKVAVECKQMQ